MKHLLFTLDDVCNSGIVNVVNNLVSKLVNEDYEISVICLQISDDKKMLPGIKYFNLDIDKYGKKLRYLFLIPKLRLFFKKNNFDSLIVSGMEFVPFFFLSSIGFHFKKIAWEHRNFYAGPVLRLEWLGKRIACNCFDSVVCITEKDLSLYKGYSKKNNIIHIYNLSEYKISDHNYDSSSSKILSVGSLESVKGFDMLLDVAEIVFSKKNNWSWDIYGSGSKKNELKSIIKQKQLENNVFLKGYANNIKDLYKDYSFFVFTSREEGMGMVLIEAQKNKLPIISFDIMCGPSEVIIDYINGFLIKPFDINDMSKKIVYLMENEELRIKMSNNSRILHDKLEPDVIINKWKNLL